MKHWERESAWLLDGLGAAVLCGLAVALALAGTTLWLAWRVW